MADNAPEPASGSEHPTREQRAAAHRRRRRVVRVAAVALVSLIVARFAFAGLQTNAIFPGHATQGQPEAQIEPQPGMELVKLVTKSGETTAGIFARALDEQGRPHPNPETRPTVLFFYGNGMCLSRSQGQVEMFRKLGVNVLIPEYVGYGLASGKPGETGCFETADAAYAYLLTRKDVNPKLIVAAGWSLGAAVAVDLAARQPVAGLMIYSAFTSMVDMVHHALPLLPARLLVQHPFKSEQKIARVKCPTLVVHGREDQLIPHEMSDRLAKAAGGKVTRLSIDGAGHNDLFHVGAEKIDKTTGQFLESLHE